MTAVFGVPGQNINTLAYADGRLAVVPVVGAARRPLVTDKKYPIWTEWRVNKNAQAPAAEGEFWKLVKFEANGDASWVRFTSGGVAAGVSDLRDGSNTNVTPDPATLEIDINAVVIANAATPFTSVADPGTHTLNLNVQVATTAAATPANTNNCGIACYNSAQFTIDATSGLVSLAGGGVNPPILNFDVDTATVPGTDPVLASGTGQISILGAVVAAHSVPVETHSRAVNSFRTEVQVGSTVAPTPVNTNAVGLLSANANQFTIDATSGMLSLIGGAVNPPITNFNVDANTIPGTDPVLANGTGQIAISGAVVAAHSVPLETRSRAANAFNIEAQIASTVAPTPGTSVAVGMISANANQFTIDATSGMLSLIGGAVNPPILNFNVQAATGPGTDPVLASGTGEVAINGAVVAQHSVPVETHSRAANTFSTEIQIATTVAPTPVNSNAVGLISANSNQFTIDATSGMLSLAGGTANAAILTLTGDSGGALPPDGAGNINIVGTGGVVVAGAGTTLTISALNGAWTWNTIAVAGTTAGVTLNGYIANSAVGLVVITLPAGVAGSEIRVLGMGAGLFQIGQGGGSTIMFGNLTTAPGGTITSQLVGDSIWLVCRAPNDWTVISSQGNLIVA